MQIYVFPGWPLRYAHVAVEGLRTEHANHGTICLWAEDDPAQIDGRDLDALWARLDGWAEAVQQGFGLQDRALDAYMMFEDRNDYHVELPFGDLVRQGSTGYRAELVAEKRGQKTLIMKQTKRGERPTKGNDDSTSLRGVFYLNRKVPAPPRNLKQVRASLTRGQRKDLDRGLGSRTSAGLGEPSGSYDFIVLAWRRFGLEHDAVVVGFEGQGDSLRASAMAATPNDIAARKRRAGPDAELLSNKKVLIAGAGSVGGHVAVALASSGIGTLHLYDDDYLKTGNVVRHVSPTAFVGYKKTLGVALMVEDHAPWTKVEQHGLLSHDPTDLADQIAEMDLVVDCTGIFSITAALAETCRRGNVALITGALFHQGAMSRTQRQATGDTLIAARSVDSAYMNLPPEESTSPSTGFLELGCTALINNAPPIAVMSAAADVSDACIDFLSGWRRRPDERITVFRPLPQPFDRTGTFEPRRHEGGIV